MNLTSPDRRIILSEDATTRVVTAANSANGEELAHATPVPYPDTFGAWRISPALPVEVPGGLLVASPVKADAAGRLCTVARAVLDAADDLVDPSAATAARLAGELAELRLAVADVTGLPIRASTEALIDALRRLNRTQEKTP